VLVDVVVSNNAPVVLGLPPRTRLCMRAWTLERYRVLITATLLAVGVLIPVCGPGTPLKVRLRIYLPRSPVVLGPSTAGTAPGHDAPWCPYRSPSSPSSCGRAKHARLVGVPIANCFTASVPDDLDPGPIVAAWSKHAAISADEMTVNLIPLRQGGKRYAVMAWLYLPSLWSDEDVRALSEGLAAALSDTLSIEPSAVQVLTSIVMSGSVVEAGETVRW
jgi:hypothetical protein